MFRLKLSPIKEINQIISWQFVQKAYITGTRININTAKPVPDENHEVTTFVSGSDPSVKPTSNDTKINVNARLVPESDPFIKLSENTSDIFTKLENLELFPQSGAMRHSLPFDTMPGPQSIRYVARLWSAVPLSRNQYIQDVMGADNIFGYINWYNSMPLFKRMVREYGPVVRLQGPFGGNVVIVLLLEDALSLIQNEGAYPIRSSINSLQQYRLKHRQYKQTGPFLTCGPVWKKMRTVIEDTLKHSIEHQFSLVEKASEEFINRIMRIRNRQQEVPQTFQSEIFKWSLECTCSMMLNKSFGFLDAAGLNVSSEPARLLESVIGAIDAIRRCEFGLPFWKIVPTPGWQRLVKYSDVLDSIFNKYVYKTQESLRQKKQNQQSLTAENTSFLELLLLTDEISSEGVLTVLLDMTLIGVNALTHATTFLLYHLSRNPSAQRKLYDEIKSTRILMHKEDLTKMTYMQACIRESLRLKQPIPVLNRVLSENTVIRNYNVPKDTRVLITPQVYGMKEEYFEDATRFKPDRWLEEHLKLNNYDLGAMPFGLGSRSCFAQGLAKMQLSLFLFKVIGKYRVEYQYGEINSTNKMLAGSDRPLKFTFIDRA